MKKKKVVVIGGGTGTYTVLTGLKKYPGLDLSVIVSMMDSGGSNRVIRDEFGLLPTSDIRQCLVALAGESSSEVLRKLFTYRYESGTGITGMTFGNLFMAALTDIYNSQEVAIEKTCEILGVSGKILPVTYDDVHLLAKYEDGSEILGEHNIDEANSINSTKRIVELSLVPKAKANQKVLMALKEADVIVFGPGDLYTSVICNLLVEGVSDTLKKSKGKIVYVLNIMTRDSQTKDYKASDHVREIEKYVGRKIDMCILNSGELPKEAVLWYKKFGMTPVEDDISGNDDYKVIRKNVVSDFRFKKDKSDKLTRSLIRHDPDKLARVINQFFE